MNHTKTNVDPSAQPYPPKIPGWPVVGVLPQFYWKQLNFLLEARANYGDIFRLDLGKTEIIVLGHPDYAQHVLVDNAGNYRTKGGTTAFRISSVPLAGDGVTTTTQSEDWRRQRRALQPFFHRNYLEHLTTVMSDVVATQTAHWDAVATTLAPFDIAEEMTCTAMRAVAKMVYGVDIEADQALKLSDTIQDALDYLWIGTVNDLSPKWAAKPGLHHCQQAIQGVSEMVDHLVVRALHEEADEGNLIKQLWEKDHSLTTKQLRDEGISMLFAASESLSAMLGWMFHLLLQHPQAMSTLQNEVDMILGQQILQPQHVAQLSFARGVVQETLRLYGPIYWLQRMATEADEIAGFQIPAEAIVVVISHLIHLHPDIWKNPHEFEPERFADQSVAERHKFAWIPFGAGQRVCSAIEHSLTLGQLVLAQVLQRYQVIPIPERKTGSYLGTSLRPQGGVWVTLQKRID